MVVIIDKLPSDTNNITENTKKEKGKEQIIPEIIPLKLNNLLPRNPLANEPLKTEIIKYILMNLDISGDLDNMYENKTDNKIETKNPVMLDIVIPITVLTGTLNSVCLLTLFLPIKKSLTFI